MAEAKSNRKPKIIIIGAGLGGLALGLSLHNHSIPATIYESRPAPDADSSNQASYFSPNGDGGYLALAPNALRVLDRLGVYQQIRTAGFEYDEMQFRSARNLSLIGNIESGSDRNKGYRCVRAGRGHLRRTLLNLAQDKGIEIIFGKKLTGLEETEAAVTCTFNDDSKIDADIVVGADGIHSKVRELVQPDHVPEYVGQVSLGGSLETTKLGHLADGLQMPCMLIGKANSFALMPCSYNGDKLTVFATIEMEDRSRDEWSTLGRDKAKLQTIMAGKHGPDSDWPEIVKRACSEMAMDDMHIWPAYRVRTLDRYVSDSGKVIVIGDSAHGMPPHTGQGSAMAFEDAATLADSITSSGGDDRLLRWQNHRVSRIEQVLAFTERSGAFRKGSSNLFAQITKEYVMWAALWWKSGSIGMDWLYGYDTRNLDRI